MYSSGISGRHRNGNSLISQMLNIRTFTIFVCIILIIILFYYYNESQDILSKFEHEKDNCQQKLDSVSAQFQVVYEHKSRLEKSVQQEIENNAKLKHDNELVLKNAKESAQKEQKKLESKYDELQQREHDVQGQFKELQQKHSNLKQELDRLEEEKKASKIKTDESLKAAENRVNDIERQYADLAKEVEKLRKENSQLKQTVSDQQIRIIEVNQRLQETSLSVANLSPNNAQRGLPQSADQILKNSSLTYSDGMFKRNAFGYAKNASSPLVDNFVVTVEKVPPFHQVPPSSVDGNFVQNGSRPIESNVNSPLLAMTHAPMPDVKQIQKPFADSHQQQLMENAKFPPVDGGQPNDHPEGQPVLQHPLGEDQQNLIAKPVKFDANQQRLQEENDTGVNHRQPADDDKDDGENIGHLPVNVREGRAVDDFDDVQQQPVVDDNKRVDNVLPLPKDNRRDGNKAVEHDNKRRGEKNVEAGGARVVKEPKEYHHGEVVGGGGEKDENDEYRDDEEEKKFKDTDQ